MASQSASVTPPLVLFTTLEPPPMPHSHCTLRVGWRRPTTWGRWGPCRHPLTARAMVHRRQLVVTRRRLAGARRQSLVDGRAQRCPAVAHEGPLASTSSTCSMGRDTQKTLIAAPLPPCVSSITAGLGTPRWGGGVCGKLIDMRSLRTRPCGLPVHCTTGTVVSCGGVAEWNACIAR